MAEQGQMGPIHERSRAKQVLDRREGCKGTIEQQSPAMRTRHHNLVKTHFNVICSMITPRMQ